MGAKKVTPEEIVKMHVLYQKYGSYAEVGRKIGRSGSTVAKYIQMNGVPLAIQIIVQNRLKEND